MLRVNSVEDEHTGPRTLFDVPLAKDKELQVNIVDRLLFRLCSTHPYSSYFQEPFQTLEHEMYAEMAKRGVDQIFEMQYGLRLLHRVKFKDDQ